VALPFTLKNILRQKKNYEIQMFHHGKTYSSKAPLKETKILQNIIIQVSTQAKISIFQKSSYKNRYIT